MRFESLFFSPDVLYTKTSEWAKKQGENFLTGIDDYAQSALGDIIYIELPEAGTQVRAGMPFGSLEATKSVSELNAPVSGQVVKVNQAVIKTPGIVNSDPFGEGWMIEIAPSSPADLDALMDKDAYKSYVRAAALQ